MNDSQSLDALAKRQKRERAKKYNGNGGGTPLAMAVKLWPTPAARDHKGANGAEHLENGTGRKHLDQLPNFVEHLWSGDRPIPSQAVRFQSSLRDPENSISGATSLPTTPRSPRLYLNPIFDEWLMGWPLGWTGSLLVEMESYLFRQRQALSGWLARQEWGEVAA